MSKILVIGLEGSGTRWVTNILREILGKDAVNHRSLPRNWPNNGRYFHTQDRVKDRTTRIAVVVRDSGACQLSNIRYNLGDWEECQRNCDRAAEVIAEYIESDLDCEIISYETAMYLGDVYLLPIIERLTGTKWPANKSIIYQDGNKKYLSDAKAKVAYS